MTQVFSVKKIVYLNAKIPDVWEALTNPDITEKYFLDCKAISNWQIGGPLIFNTIVDDNEVTVVKGIITAIEQDALLEYSCFIPELELIPSTHTTVSCRLLPKNDGTKLIVRQGSFEDSEILKQYEDSWDKVLDGLKAIVEKHVR